MLKTESSDRVSGTTASLPYIDFPCRNCGFSPCVCACVKPLQWKVLHVFTGMAIFITALRLHTYIFLSSIYNSSGERERERQTKWGRKKRKNPYEIE